MNIHFTPLEARAIGCLMEKSLLTPDQYPLSLNALVSACNQKSSRDPVLSLDPGTVQRTVNDLLQKKMVMTQSFGSRVEKYQQRFCNTTFAELSFTAQEFAIVCLLLLRGPQTPGELKAHSGRLHEFRDLAEVDEALQSLMSRPGGPMIARLPREPRRKDHRYAHLFGGAIESEPPAMHAAAAQPAATRTSNAPAELEARVAKLEQEVAALRRQIDGD